MKMKSYWVVGKRRIEERIIDYRPPGRGEASVRIESCGICGTDLHYYREFPSDDPLPLGHEVSGRVYETGPGVSGLKEGDGVILENHIACGTCRPCRENRPWLCRNIQTYMRDRAGLAEYLTVDSRMVVPYGGLDSVEAAMAEPLTVALDLMREASVEPYHNVCVSGPGIIGLFCVFLARRAGAGTVIALGHGMGTPRGRKRMSMAGELGATHLFDTDTPGWKEEVRGLDVPIERVIVTSPPATIPDLLDLASFGAHVVFNGISFEKSTLSFDANYFHFRKLRLIASHAIPNWGFPLAFHILAENRAAFKDLVSHRFPVRRLEEAFRTAVSPDQEYIKGIITL
jgi:L-iditol 2-dehydrogenase